MLPSDQTCSVGEYYAVIFIGDDGKDFVDDKTLVYIRYNQSVNQSLFQAHGP